MLTKRLSASGGDDPLHHHLSPIKGGGASVEMMDALDEFDPESGI
jgi:hypothetical protein